VNGNALSLPHYIQRSAGTCIGVTVRKFGLKSTRSYAATYARIAEGTENNPGLKTETEGRNSLIFPGNECILTLLAAS
jgi:hypothetical protein